MSRHWDEFSMSLADKSVPRRQSLQLLGAALAGALLSPLGLGTAWAGRPDPCKAFCRCSHKTKQNQCLAACQACSGNTSRLTGSCGNYVCCPTAACDGQCSDLRSDPNCGACGNDCRDFGETCCGNYCADLANDFDNCGACGAPCDYPGPYEDGACVDGQCFYSCVPGTVNCGDGACTALWADPNNCGACGNVCPDTEPYCGNGVCFDPGCAPGLAFCQGICTDLNWDNNNCGTCNHQCEGGSTCLFGSCQSGCPGC